MGIRVGGRKVAERGGTDGIGGGARGKGEPHLPREMSESHLLELYSNVRNNY